MSANRKEEISHGERWKVNSITGQENPEVM
jgi:hypothetical protein